MPYSPIRATRPSAALQGCSAGDSNFCAHSIILVKLLGIIGSAANHPTPILYRNKQRTEDLEKVVWSTSWIEWTMFHFLKILACRTQNACLYSTMAFSCFFRCTARDGTGKQIKKNSLDKLFVFISFVRLQNLYLNCYRF